MLCGVLCSAALPLWVSSGQATYSPAPHCDVLFDNLMAGKTVRTAGILSPDGRYVSWSDTELRKAPGLNREELQSGRVVLRSRVSGSERAILRTRLNSTGRVLWPDGKADEFTNASAFCVVDWSPDSRYLLVIETIAELRSDVISEFYWVHDLRQQRARQIPTKRLREAIAKAGTTTERVSKEDIWLRVQGFEQSHPSNIVFHAHDPHVRGFLGFWSIPVSGGPPRLLSEDESAVHTRPFGTLLR